MTLHRTPNRRWLITAGLVAASLPYICWNAAHGQVSTPTPDQLQSILDQLGTSTTDTSTDTTPPTDTGTDGTGDIGDGSAPTTGGGALGNVRVGALQERSPGRMVNRGIAEAAGTVTIAGDADDFEEPNFVKQTIFDSLEAALTGVEQGLTQLLQSLLLGLGLGTGGLFGPGQINVGDPIANAATLGSGTIIPLP